MGAKAAITVYRSREEVERLWRSSQDSLEHAAGSGTTVTFKEAPGGRGTEVHVDLEGAGGGRLGELVQGLVGAAPLPKVKDDLRRFKQQVETGEVLRSDGAPGGESVGRKFKQRPAQPLEVSELEQAGAA